MKRRHFTHTLTLKERLAQEAERLRQEARGTPPGIERERMILPSPAGGDSFAYAGMAFLCWPPAAPLKNAYASGYIGRTYRADDHRDDCRLRD
jgi:hypothetical protein